MCCCAAKSSVGALALLAQRARKCSCLGTLKAGVVFGVFGVHHFARLWAVLNPFYDSQNVLALDGRPHPNQWQHATRSPRWLVPKRPSVAVGRSWGAWAGCTLARLSRPWVHVARWVGAGSGGRPQNPSLPWPFTPPGLANERNPGLLRLRDVRVSDKSCLLYTSPSPRDRG